MSRETRPLVRLEHPIGKRVLLGHLQVRLNVRGFDVLELRIGISVLGASRRGQIAWDKVRPIHLAHPGSGVQVTHFHERAVAVVQIVVIWIGTDRSQVNRSQRNGLMLGIDSRTGDVVLPGIGPAAGHSSISAAQSLKQVVGRAILLEDDHHVLQIVVWRWEP